MLRYSASAIREQYQAARDAMEISMRDCTYQLKGNSTSRFSAPSRAGRGLDIVSGGELYRALKAATRTRYRFQRCWTDAP